MLARSLASLLMVGCLLRTGSAYGQEEPPPPTTPATPPAVIQTAPPSAPPPGGDAAPPKGSLPFAPGFVPGPRLEYVGTAGPSTSAGTTPLAFFVHPGIELFAEYAYTLTYPSSGSATWFHEFDVPRAHASVDGEYGPVRGRFVLEGVQSANDGALIGVGGDSIVLRIREAFAAWSPIRGLEIAGGVVPTLTIPELDGTWLLRVIAPSTLENSGLGSPADLGGTVRFTFPLKYGWIAVGVYNGEGYDNPELNRGKNVEVAAEVHPFPNGSLLPLAIFGSYVGGSSGTDSAQANRTTGAIVWQGKRVRAGVDYTYAWGVGDDAVQDSTITEGFVRVEPINRLLLGARASYWIRNTGAPSTDAITTLWGSAGWRVADPLEFHLAVTRSLPTSFTQSELAGSDYLELRAVTRIVF